jgi:hypothetical protein
LRFAVRRNFTQGGRNRNFIVAAILEKPALEGCIVTADATDMETKSGVIGRRKQTAWSNEYLEKLLFQSPFASGGNLYAPALALRAVILHLPARIAIKAAAQGIAGARQTQRV